MKVTKLLKSFLA